MIIIHYKEIALKGKNRIDFERQLRRNVKDCLKRNKINFEKVQRLRGRIVVDTEEKCPQLTKVSGISSFSYAKKVELNLEEIKKIALEHYSKGTFCVRCKRSAKNLLKSPEMEREVGAYIVEKTGAKVKLKDPDTTIQLEITERNAFIYTTKIPGMGGIPVSSQNYAILLLQDKNSLEAAKLMIKRGTKLDIYKEKDVDWSILREYEYGFRINEIEEISQDSIVVVSDTIDTIKEYSYTVLRPLIGKNI